MNITAVVARDRAYVRRLMREDARGFISYMIFYLASSLLVSVLCFVSSDGRAVLAGFISLSLAGLGGRAAVDTWRRHREQWPAYYLEPTTFTFTNDCIVIDSVTVSARMSWAAVTRVVERPHAYLLFVHPLSYRDVPRSGLTGPQDNELRAFLVNRGLLAAGASSPAPATTVD
jgi:YcxB-like protein